MTMQNAATGTPYKTSNGRSRRSGGARSRRRRTALARLHVTHGLGHHRILHDERVIAASVDFLMAGSGC